MKKNSGWKWIVWGVIRDMWIILQNRWLGVFIATPPEGWSCGQRGDVLMIHGYAGSWISMRFLGDACNKAGYRVHILTGLRANTMPLKRGVELAEKYISEHKLNNLVVIGHSKGGLIGRYLMQSDLVGSKIRRLFMVATPNQGSWAALGHYRAWEMLPISKTLGLLRESEDMRHKITNFYPKVDTLVVPNNNMILPGVENVCIKEVGHANVLRSDELIGQITMRLN